MDDGPGCALDRLEGAADDMVAALGQHLHGDIVGDHVLLDEGAQKLILGVAGGRKAHLDLLEADLQQYLVELQLLLQAHRHHQTLVAIPQVHAAPGGGSLDMVLLHPLVHVPRLHRRGIVANLIFRRVHHVKVLLPRSCLWKKDNKKSHLSKDHQSLRDGSKKCCTRGTTLIAGRPGHSVRSAPPEGANRVCMITDSGRPHLKAMPLSAAAQGPVTRSPPYRLAPTGGSLKQGVGSPFPLHRILEDGKSITAPPKDVK